MSFSDDEEVKRLYNASVCGDVSIVREITQNYLRKLLEGGYSIPLNTESGGTELLHPEGFRPSLDEFNKAIDLAIHWEREEIVQILLPYSTQAFQRLLHSYSRTNPRIFFMITTDEHKRQGN